MMQNSVWYLMTWWKSHCWMCQALSERLGVVVVVGRTVGVWPTEYWLLTNRNPMFKIVVTFCVTVKYLCNICFLSVCYTQCKFNQPSESAPGYIEVKMSPKVTVTPLCRLRSWWPQSSLSRETRKEASWTLSQAWAQLVTSWQMFHHFVLLNVKPFFSFQDLMNREKRDKIPSMQVSFIDAICVQLYEASLFKFSLIWRQEVKRNFHESIADSLFYFTCALSETSLSLSQTLAGMSEHCSPLLEGCQRNRQHWKRLAEECEKGLVNGLVWSGTLWVRPVQSRSHKASVNQHDAFKDKWFALFVTKDSEINSRVWWFNHAIKVRAPSLAKFLYVPISSATEAANQGSQHLPQYLCICDWCCLWCSHSPPFSGPAYKFWRSLLVWNALIISSRFQVPFVRCFICLKSVCSTGKCMNLMGHSKWNRGRMRLEAKLEAFRKRGVKAQNSTQGPRLVM